MGEFTIDYLDNIKQIATLIDIPTIERMASSLADLRAAGGRLFFLGVGGSAGNCGHAVNDFRKICGIESYAPTDNVSELTARTNDDGWETVFANWLKGSRLRKKDGIFIFSVGGGNSEKRISVNLVQALDLAGEIGCRVFGVVGKDGGYTAKVAPETVVVIPTTNPQWITPLTEAWHAVVWHLLVTHPALKVQETKWESTTGR